MELNDTLLAKPRSNILLVDDNPANLLALRVILDGLGQNLVDAHSGEEALQRTGHDEFAAVLLDVHMPGLGGFETAKLIREQDKPWTTPIIFLTAQDIDRAQLEEGYLLGAVDFLVKPLLPVILRAKVAGFVELFEKTQQIRDIGERKRAEQQRTIRLTVTQVLAQATTLRQAVCGVLRTICEGLGWDIGLFWTLDQEGQVLRCLESWRNSRIDTTEFETASRQRTFSVGVGLPGRIWMTGRSAWVSDVVQDTNFPRAPIAVNQGLHGAFGSPIVIEGETLGIIEFFSEEIRAPDADLLEMMDTVCGQIGQFAERKLAEDQLRESEQDLADFFENATIGMHWIGPDGTILRVNRAELDMLGYEREEYVGHHISEFHADRKVICDILERLQAGEKLDEYPARLCCKNGQVKDVLMGSSVMWRDGNFVHTRCFTRDITEQKQASEALRYSEQRFARFMQHLPGLAWIKDLHGRYVYANDAAVEIFGVTRAQLYGSADEDMFAASTAAQFKENDQRALASGTAVQVIESLEGRDGILRQSLVSKFPILGADGKAALVGGMAIDITEQRRAEEQNRFQAHLLDTVGQAAIVSDPGGTIIYWNRFAESLYGWASSEALGRNLIELVVAPDESAQAVEILSRLQSEESWSGELRVRRRDRTVFPAFVTETPIFADDGALKAIISVSVDMTDRKRTEQGLRFLADASATLSVVEDYESTLQKVAGLAVPYFADWCAVDMVESDGQLRHLAVVHMDPAKLALAEEFHRRYPPPPTAVHGRPQVMRTGESDMITDIPDELLVQGAVDADHLRILRALGFRSYMCVPLKSRGKLIGVVSFVSSESERRFTKADLVFAEELARRAAIAIENAQLYAELREADRRKDEFLATLAHELRNPLAPIRNSLEVLKMPRLDAAIAQQTREVIERQVHHLVRLVDDLLDVSRVMRGKIELRKESIELASIVARAVETAQPLIEAQGQEITITLPPESLRMNADPVRLAQVLGNLLTNAAKYTEAHGRIWLTAKRDGDQVELRIRDNGIGIAPDMLPHIFELFVQADQATTRSQGGLGIGLTLVKSLVEMHHGTIEVRSGGLGKGSEFIIRLQLSARQPEEPSGITNGEQPLANSTAGLRLMVVDDNADSANSLAMLLRLFGHEVRIAHNGADTLAMVTVYRPDMIFLDIGMPVMDGYEVARRLRKQADLQHIVLAALTGWGQQEDRRRSAEAGFDHHLVKPLEAKVLKALLADLKASRGQVNSSGEA